MPAVAAALAGCAPGQRIGASYAVRSAASAASPNEAFGAQVRLTDGLNARYRGEAIACDEQRVYLRVNVTDGEREPYVAFNWRDVAALEVALPGSGWAFGVWTALGTVSTISHGYWAVFSHAGWLAAGIPASVAANNPSIAVASCLALRPYLRFPQGIPETFAVAHYARVIPPPSPRSPPSDAPWALPSAPAPEPSAPPPEPEAPSQDAGAPDAPSPDAPSPDAPSPDVGAPSSP